MAASRDLKHCQKNRELSWRRRWVFRLMAISLPLVLLATLEGTLHLFGYGVPTSFTLEHEIAGQTMRVSNPRFTWQFFGQDLAREVFPFAMAPEKRAGTCRIFMLGGSAAMGTPEPTFGMARALEVILRHRYPDVNFDVVNVAITASNSYVMFPIAKECSVMDADLLVVYLGNNEVVGPYGAGSVFKPLASRNAIRTAMAVRSLRGVQAIRSLLERRRDWREWEGMEMFREGQVRLTDRALARTYAQFENNLRDIYQVGLREGVGVVLSTVGVNLKNCAPFASLHAVDLSTSALRRWEEAYGIGIEHSAAQRWREAIVAYEAASEIDNTHAELHYRLGRCHEALGRHAAAFASYSQARDLDTLRFRADTRINALIRQVAADGASDGVVLADAEARLADAAPHGISGSESFFEHVHLRFEGNVVVARALADAADKALPDWVRQRRSSTSPLSAEQCAKRMGYTPLARYEDLGRILEMMSRAPFTNQFEHDADLSALKDEERSLAEWARGEKPKEALAELRRVTDSGRTTPGLRAYFASSLLKYGGDPGEAEAIVADLASELPPTDDTIAITHVKSLLQQRRHDEAMARFELAIAARPWDQHLLSEMGQAFADSGDFETAHKVFAKAAERSPGNPKAHNNLATVSSHLGRHKEAVEHFQEALRIRPDFAEVHHNLGIALQASGSPRVAAAHYEKALRIKPDFAEARYDWGIALQTLGRHQEAAEHYQKALQIRPDYAEAHLNLGNCMLALARHQDAVAHYQEALRIRPDYASAHYRLGNALRKQGHFDEAVTHLQHTLRATPDSLAVQIELVDTLKRIGRHREALPLFEELLRRKPEHAGFHDQLGLCLLKLGRLDEAEERFQQAVRLRGDFLDARINLARVLLLQKRPDEAVEHYEHVLKLKPDHLVALNDLAWLLGTSVVADVRDGQRAVTLAKEAVRLTEHKNPSLLDSLSVAYAETGNFQEAIRWQTKAIELAPEPMKEALRQRLQLYISGKPFREAP